MLASMNAGDAQEFASNWAVRRVVAMLDAQACSDNSNLELEKLRAYVENEGGLFLHSEDNPTYCELQVGGVSEMRVGVHYTLSGLTMKLQRLEIKRLRATG